MELHELENLIQTLATLPETETPVISCYLLLENGRLQDNNIFEQRIRDIKGSITVLKRFDIDQATDPIMKYLNGNLKPNTKGVAIFSRSGNEPFFLGLQFHVPLPNWIAVNSIPNIYHLMELKDTYHRYVVMLSGKDHARILEINLGSVTKETQERHSGFRQRAGRKFTKDHYQNHQKERGRKFIKEKIKTLERLISTGDHSHLILAGHPANVALIRKELPRNLSDKLIDIIPASSKTTLTNVVESSIASFIEAEEAESRTIAQNLFWQIQTGGLAVAGTGPSYLALQRGQADTLVLAQSYSPGQAWKCVSCELMNPLHDKPESCPACGSTELKDLDVKEDMVRLAEQNGCGVEVVNVSEELIQLGSVGCLLRYERWNNLV
ncbi:MAG: hypothetical protein GY869_15035 [Planctomycetes bacterium]|nr:hypothetical protein [Planctomycetota bacterium]